MIEHYSVAILVTERWLLEFQGVNGRRRPRSGEIRMFRFPSCNSIEEEIDSGSIDEMFNDSQTISSYNEGKDKLPKGSILRFLSIWKDM